MSLHLHNSPIITRCQFLLGLIFLCLTVNSQHKEASKGFTIVAYNCENLFDCRHDSLKDDYEFLPNGEKAWTFPRLWRKINNIGRVIHQCGGKGKGWHLPDIVALTEVENDSVLHMLTRMSLLKTMGYRYLITNSSYLRGTDVAILFNPLTFKPLEHYSIRIDPPKNHKPTRDILYIKGKRRTGDTLHIFTVHAPSRSGGEYLTERYRIVVAHRVVASVDSIRSQSANAQIVVLGDFNDYSRNASIEYYTSHNLIEVSETAAGINNPKEITGTYKYQKKWESLDHIFLTPPLHRKAMQCYILDNTWMLQNDKQGGRRPRRTYFGPFYNGGISDHLPLVLNLK